MGLLLAPSLRGAGIHVLGLRGTPGPHGAAQGGILGPPGPALVLLRPQPVPGLRLLPKWPLGFASRGRRGCKPRVGRASCACRQHACPAARTLAVQTACKEHARSSVRQPRASAVQGAGSEPRAPAPRAPGKQRAAAPRALGKQRAPSGGECGQPRRGVRAPGERASERAAARSRSAAPASPSLRRKPTACEWHLARSDCRVITHRITF